MSGPDDASRKRSDSAPPCRGPRGANSNVHERLVSLFERSERIQEQIDQVNDVLSQEMSSEQNEYVGVEASNEGHLSGEVGTSHHSSKGSSDHQTSASSDHQSSEDGSSRRRTKSSDDHQTSASSHHPSARPSGESSATNEPVTTLMLCGLPCRLEQEEIVDVINRQGFSKEYDLLYLPSPKEYRNKKASRRNLGYGFVNLKTPEAAVRFAQAFNGFAFPGCSSAKLSYTKPALRQGYDANYKEHLKEGTACFLYCPEAEGSASQSSQI